MKWMHLVDTQPAWENGAADILWSLVLPTNVVNAMSQHTTPELALKEGKNPKATMVVEVVEVVAVLVVVLVEGAGAVVVVLTVVLVVEGW